MNYLNCTYLYKRIIEKNKINELLIIITMILSYNNKTEII